MFAETNLEYASKYYKDWLKDPTELNLERAIFFMRQAQAEFGLEILKTITKPQTLAAKGYTRLFVRNGVVSAYAGEVQHFLETGCNAKDGEYAYDSKLKKFVKEYAEARTRESKVKEAKKATEKQVALDKNRNWIMDFIKTGGGSVQ